MSFKGKGNKYISLSLKEKAILVIEGLAVMAVLDWFFYRSLWALLPLSAAGAGFAHLKYREKLEEKRHEVKLEFKELLLLSCTGLRAGYSIENAMLQSVHDLSRLYGRDSAICALLKEIHAARKNNRPVAEVFRSAGESMKIEDIAEFGSVYEIAYKRSGNLTEVMDRTASGIVEKLKVEEEIHAALNERRFEMRIMNLMPFAIMLYISLTSRGYFERMYHNLLGALVMSAAMGIYIAAYLWSNKIAEIRL